jgi:hypothetical protein
MPRDEPPNAALAGVANQTLALSLEGIWDLSSTSSRQPLDFRSLHSSGPAHYKMQRSLELLGMAYVDRPHILFSLSVLVSAYWFYIYVQRRRQYQVSCVDRQLNNEI